MIGRLVLFGATGDLAGRFLLPALAELHAARRLPDGLAVVGTAREDWDDEAFRRHAAERLDEHAAETPAESRAAVARSLRYRRVDFEDPESVARAVAATSPGDGAGGEPVAAYLALPSRVFPAAVRALGAVGLPAGSRIAVEKPFGEDLDSAVALNALLRRVAGVEGERAVFRVDHALALSTVQNILAVRLANRVFEPVWNGAHVERVDILWDETLALEGRAGYYDRTGALKDVTQNHLLQVLCVLAMEPPLTLGERDLRDRKLDVLRAVRPLTPEDVVSGTRRARHTAGRVGDREVPAYVDEEGIDPARGTETFAEVVLRLDNWRWDGTPFLLRTGKALARRRKEAVVRFRPVPRPPFGGAAATPAPSELRIGLDGPWDLTLRLTGGVAEPQSRLMPLVLNAALPAPELPAYSRVLLDVLDGDTSLSIRGDEAEQAWRVLTPVLEAWADGRVPLEEYPAGSDGPPPRGGPPR